MPPFGLRVSPYVSKPPSTTSKTITNPLGLGNLQNEGLQIRRWCYESGSEDKFVLEDGAADGGELEVDLGEFFTPGRLGGLVDYEVSSTDRSSEQELFVEVPYRMDCGSDVVSSSICENSLLPWGDDFQPYSLEGQGTNPNLFYNLNSLSPNSHTPSMFGSCLHPSLKAGFTPESS